MNREQRLATLRAVLAVAWSDGDFDHREQRLVDQLMDSDFSLMLELNRQTGHDDAGSQLMDILPEYDERLACYREAARMSAADGVIHPEEREILKKLRNSLLITKSDALAVETKIIEPLTPPTPYEPKIVREEFDE